MPLIPCEQYSMLLPVIAKTKVCSKDTKRTLSSLLWIYSPSCIQSTRIIVCHCDSNSQMQQIMRNCNARGPALNYKGQKIARLSLTNRITGRVSRDHRHLARPHFLRKRANADRYINHPIATRQAFKMHDKTARLPWLGKHCRVRLNSAIRPTSPLLMHLSSRRRCRMQARFLTQ
jgi:hypothetical protein